MMAKKFTEQEKRFIRKKLLTEGKSIFEVQGLQKTSIGELTKKAGIAQGTFYQFFSSKEELYFDIIEQEEQAIQTELVDGISKNPKLTKSSFANFLQQALHAMEKSPILCQLHDESLMAILIRKIPQEKLEMNSQRDAAFLTPLIEQWQAEGQLRQLPPAVIVSMIRSLILLSLQKTAIGEGVYDQTMTQFIRMMADSLVLEEEKQ